MKIELSNETIRNIIKQELKYRCIKTRKGLDRCVKTRKGSGYVSFNYKEEKKHLSEMVKSLEVLLNYYGIEFIEELIWLNYILVIINTARE